MEKTMTIRIVCAIAALLSILVMNFGAARASPPAMLDSDSDEMILGPAVVGPPVILPEPLPIIPISPVVGPPVILPEPLPLIPGPGGTWSPSAQPNEESSDPLPLEEAPSGRQILCKSSFWLHSFIVNWNPIKPFSYGFDAKKYCHAQKFGAYRLFEVTSRVISSGDMIIHMCAAENVQCYSITAMDLTGQTTGVSWRPTGRYATQVLSNRPSPSLPISSSLTAV